MVQLMSWCHHVFFSQWNFFWLRNMTTKYMRWESTLSSLKKHQELNVSRDMKLTKNVDCNTNHSISPIECNQCNKQYVGETKRKFITHFKEHLADIWHNRDTPVTKHYKLSSHKKQYHTVIPPSNNFKSNRRSPRPHGGRTKKQRENVDLHIT